MPTTRTLVLSSLLAAGLIWSQVPATTKTAVVNLQAVLEGYNDGKKRMEDLRKLSDDYNQEIEKPLKEWEKLRDQHKQLTAEITVYKQGSTERRIRAAELERIARTAELYEGQAAALRQAYGADLEKRKAELVVEIHNKIKEAVATMARNLKVDLVLRVGEDGAEDSTEQKARSLMLRQVIYHDRSLDLTKDVIAVLNTEAQK